VTVLASPAMTVAHIRETIRSFILKNFLPGEPPETLTDSTQLITSGVMTSIAMLELVDFLEEEFAFTLEPEDIHVARMNSIELLAELVAEKTRTS
jgi:acyl carrier protein